MASSFSKDQLRKEINGETRRFGVEINFFPFLMPGNGVIEK